MFTVRRSGKEACGSCCSRVIKLQLFRSSAGLPLRAGSTSPCSVERALGLSPTSQSGQVEDKMSDWLFLLHLKHVRVFYFCTVSKRELVQTSPEVDFR